VPRYGRVVLGGTFDRLHIGHAALLATAFHAGRRVAIGLTTPHFLAVHAKPGARRIQPFATRRRALARFLTRKYGRGRWTITSLDDGLGRSVEDGVDAIVVSADTVAGGRAVNVARRHLGRRTVPLLVVPLVLADDLRPVSSRRIRAGEIDRDGRRVGPVRVGLALQDRSDLAAVVRAVRAAFPRARIRRVPFDTGHSRHLTPLDGSLRRATRVGELGLAVGRGTGGRRVVLIGVGRIALPPLLVPRRARSRLADTVAVLLRRSAAAKL